ncbi:MAG: spermidine synthase [Thermoproteota archaeon]
MPLIFEDRVPEEVLVLGAGDGLLAEELLKYRKIKKITQIELDPKMIELANTHPLLTQYNHHSLQNERVNLIIGDAFQFIRNSTKKYDAIYVDFPFPFNFNLSKLFSVEFYKLLYNSINEDGFITLDLPLGRYIKNEIYITEPIKNINAIAFSTLKAAGFKTIKPYFSDEDSFVYLKKKKIENFRSYTQTFFNRETPGKKFNYLTLKNFKKTLNATFPYSRGNQYINSIFKPTSMHYLFYINSL